MFVCILAGGMTVALAIGLLDVLVLHADAIDSQKTESASADLVLGLLLLVAGALVATGHLHGRRKAPVPAGNRPPEQPEKKDGWAERALAEPRLGLAMLIGALAGIPGFAYLSALNKLVTGESSTVVQVAAVILFVLIEFALIIIPFAFLVFRPEATKALLKHAQDWLTGHSRQLIADTAMILGAFMAISGLVQLI
jgi:fructose-specific phosphotransferase system IIC component